MPTLNEVFSSPSTHRRYEVWFVRVGLADGSGAWWLRYLLLNPGKNGCAGHPSGTPVQVWATWFPRAGKPESFIQGFSPQELKLSTKGVTPFQFHVRENEIGENFCRGLLESNGRRVSWDLRYASTFHVTLSSKGWIGFSRTPHSDAIFSGEVTIDGQTFKGDPLGFGVQGHNCGYRHRNFWYWTHAFFPRSGQPPTTLEALIYEMPLGLVFRKAVLWHDGKEHIFRKVNNADAEQMQWFFSAQSSDGCVIQAAIDGRGPSLHRVPYLKTSCSGSFEVMNNSLAAASLSIAQASAGPVKLETETGAVLEIVPGG